MKTCQYCHKPLREGAYENKIGYFCSEQHYELYLSSLSNEDYVKTQQSFCACSDE